MGLFSRKQKREAVVTEGVVTSTQAPSSEGKSEGNHGTDWMRNLVRPTGMESLIVAAWYRGVELRMKTMGQMKVRYQVYNAEKDCYTEARWGDSRVLNYLLQIRPNPLMSASVMQQQIEFRRIYYGNAFVYIERNDVDAPSALWLCTSGSYNFINDTYTIVYNGVGGPKFKTVSSRDVLHFRNTFLTEDMRMGIPTLTYAMKTLSLSATADAQSVNDIAKGGKHKVILQEEKSPTIGTRGRANPTQMRKVTEDFSEDWASKDVLFLDNVMDVKIVSQTAAELRLLEQRGYQVSEIARILGIPRIMMMDDAGSSYKMPEHATQEFLLRTIQPKIQEDEDEYNAKLLNIYDFGKSRIHIDERSLRRLDAKGQAEIDKIYLETGIMSPNELRNVHDMPSIKDGDTHYVSTNLAEIGSVKLRGEDPNPVNEVKP